MGTGHPGSSLLLPWAGSCASCVQRQINHEAKKVQMSPCSPFQGHAITWSYVSCKICKCTYFSGKKKKRSSPTPPPIHRTTPDAMQHRVAVGILGSDCKEVELGMPLIGVQWDSDVSHGHFRVQLSHCLPSRCSSGLCEDSSQPAGQTHQER